MGVFRVDPPLVLTKLLLVSKNVAIVSRYMNIRLFKKKHQHENIPICLNSRRFHVVVGITITLKTGSDR